MSLDNYGNIADVVVHGHKDRPAMSGAVNEWLSSSHANIYRLNNPSDVRPINATGSNDYIDFAALDSPYGSRHNPGQDGQSVRLGQFGRGGIDGRHGQDGNHLSHGRDGHHRSSAGVTSVTGEGAPDATPAEVAAVDSENHCPDDCSIRVPTGDTAGGDSEAGDGGVSDSSGYAYSAQDKLDEILLDLERAIRATGRGSMAIAIEWLREAQADMRELAQALGLYSGGSAEGGSAGGGATSGESGGEHPSSDCGAHDSNSCDSGAEPAPVAEIPVPGRDGHGTESDAVHDTGDGSTDAPDRSQPVAATIEQLLAQNDRSQNPVKPGENTAHFGWADGRSGAGIHKPATPDARYNYVMAWNMVYPEQGKTANPEASVEMQNFRTYVHTKDGQWLEVLNQNKSGIGGGLSDADFADPYAVYDSPISNRDDGVASFKAPPPGFNFQPWISDRGAFDNQNIDGIYISGLVRSDRADSNLVIDQGADWYARQSGTAVGTENSDGVGTSNWLRLTDKWQPLLYSTVSADELRRNPPPGITA